MEKLARTTASSTAPVIHVTLVLHIIAVCHMNSTNISFHEEDGDLLMDLGDLSTCGTDFVLKNVITLHMLFL